MVGREQDLANNSFGRSFQKQPSVTTFLIYNFFNSNRKRCESLLRNIDNEQKVIYNKSILKL